MNDTWFQTGMAPLDGAGMHTEGMYSYATWYNITLYNNTSQNGGAINFASGEAFMANSLVIGNAASSYAGGLFIFFSGVILTNVTIVGNRCVACSCSSPAFKRLADMVRARLRSAALGGGGLKGFQGLLYMTSCTIANNTAAAGAGLQFDAATNTYTAVPPTLGSLTNLVFQGNVATVQGGGLATGSSFDLTLTNVNFTGNSGARTAAFRLFSCGERCTATPCGAGHAAPRGGGVWIAGDGVPGLDYASMTSCSFTQNAADYGGGLYADAGTLLSLSACTFASNTAKAGGGGLTANDASSLQISDCAFTGNGVLSDNDPPLVQLRHLCLPLCCCACLAVRCVRVRRQGELSASASTSSSLLGRCWCPLLCS
jgi:predicted outer membrane repeat protein